MVQVMCKEISTPTSSIRVRSGLLYGEGVEEDEEEAVRLFSLAAGKSALVLLYLMYSCVQYEVFET